MKLISDEEILDSIYISNNFYMRSDLFKYLCRNPETNCDYLDVTFQDYNNTKLIIEELKNYKITFVLNHKYYFDGNNFYQIVRKFDYSTGHCETSYDNKMLDCNIQPFIESKTIIKKSFMNLLNESEYVYVHHKIQLPNDIQYNEYSTVENYKRFSVKHMNYINFLIDSGIKVACKGWILDGDKAQCISSSKFLINDEKSLKIVNLHSII